MKKTVFNALIGGSCCIVTAFLGEFTAGLKSLLIFMALDIITGFLCAIMSKSQKTDTGKISSKTAFVGFCKKFFIIALIGIGHHLDILFESNYLRDALVFAFLSSELISIIENAGLMGVKIPKMLKDTIDILNHRSETSDEKLVKFKKTFKK